MSVRSAITSTCERNSSSHCTGVLHPRATGFSGIHAISMLYAYSHPYMTLPLHKYPPLGEATQRPTVCMSSLADIPTPCDCVHIMRTPTLQRHASSISANHTEVVQGTLTKKRYAEEPMIDIAQALGGPLLCTCESRRIHRHPQASPNVWKPFRR
jgi:hypothetical protein